jgi:hypothetical protein
MKSAPEMRAEWLARLFSTAAADRPRAEAAVRRLYAAAGFAEPRHFLWFDSPCAASWPLALLAAPYDHSGSSVVGSAPSREEKQKAEHARAALGAQLGLADWSQVLAAVGAPRATSLQYPPDPSRILSSKLLDPRFELVEDVSELFVVPGDDDDLFRAEQHFHGGNLGVLTSGLHCHPTSHLIGQSFFNEYSFSTMADDERRVGDREVPPLLSAAWEVARSAGLWWPFENAAVMSERPGELHVNDRKLLHRGDGPATVYRDGWRVYAWNGKAVPERWILEPEKIPARDLKGFDATFRTYVESRVGKPTPKGSKRSKPGAILTAALPSDPAARLEQLRAHAGGRLPLYDRYRAGAHRQVWEELVALGPEVRADPHAADALAVAYETMQRVDANVRTIVQRLQGMRYEFTAGRSSHTGAMPQLGGLVDMMAMAVSRLTGQGTAGTPSPRDGAARPQVPPEPNIRATLAGFEKEFGTLPLSLRAFYEVVGEVNLIGRHPTLDPKGNPVAPDPLVVYGLDEGLVEDDGEDEEGASVITIAPDDLHKADTSGGDAYAMAIPDLRADGELLNERHDLFFVDYLRLCFRFGGFPGYEGAAHVPAELGTLSVGLIEL